MASISSAAILATLFGAGLFFSTRHSTERVIIAVAIPLIWISIALDATLSVGLRTHLQIAIRVTRLTGELAIMFCMLVSVIRSRKKS